MVDKCQGQLVVLLRGQKRLRPAIVSGRCGAVGGSWLAFSIHCDRSVRGCSWLVQDTSRKLKASSSNLNIKRRWSEESIMPSPNQPHRLNRCLTPNQKPGRSSIRMPFGQLQHATQHCIMTSAITLLIYFPPGITCPLASPSILRS